MSATREFYIKQAERDERDAASATLENARERSLRSAQCWRSMADMIDHTETLRQSRANEKLQAEG